MIMTLIMTKILSMTLIMIVIVIMTVMKAMIMIVILIKILIMLMINGHDIVHDQDHGFVGFRCKISELVLISLFLKKFL